jgi:hypothetical protein
MGVTFREGHRLRMCDDGTEQTGTGTKKEMTGGRKIRSPATPQELHKKYASSPGIIQ